MTADRIYLDNNATTQLLPEVSATMADAWQVAFANPGSQHGFGRNARNLLNSSRDTIASALNCNASEVIFTSGGTESINAAVFGLTVGRKGTIAVTAGEHPATTAACRRATDNGMKLVTMPVDPQGRLCSTGLEELPMISSRSSSPTK